MADHELLRRLTEVGGTSGHEDAVRALVAGEFKSLAGLTLASDRLGGLHGELRSRSDAAMDSVSLPRVMVTAHMDEVGFLVQAVNGDGGIQVVALGGWWSHTLLSQRMTLRTRAGAELLGVFAATPVHHLAQSDRERLIPVERLIFDVGASGRAEVFSLGIAPGDVLTPSVSYQPLGLPHRFVGKAFDNRLGLGCLVEIARKLHAHPAPNQLLLVASVQEEVGTRGAAVASEMARPDVAIVLECAPADDLPVHDPGGPQGALGSGVQIRLFDPTMIANPRLAELVLATARRKKIRHQVTVRRSGGTDAARIQLAHEGVPTIVLGVPARYIHSHNAIFDERDYDAMLALAVALIHQLDAREVANLTRYL